MNWRYGTQQPPGALRVSEKTWEIEQVSDTEKTPKYYICFCTKLLQKTIS